MRTLHKVALAPFGLACVLAFALVLGYPSAANAAPITFEIDTFGRLQSGTLRTDPLLITFRYTFDSEAPDAEPSDVSGSYAAGYPALSRLRIGSEVDSGAWDVGIFTNYDAFAQTYTVATGWSGSIFQGRTFFVAVFNFIDFDRTMLLSDALPTSPAFARQADQYGASFAYIPIVGDPEYGQPSSHFRVCDVRDSVDCVPAPMLLRRAMAVPEPGTFALLVLGLAGLAFARRRKQ